jgi:hypothetical protein
MVLSFGHSALHALNVGFCDDSSLRGIFPDDCLAANIGPLEAIELSVRLRTDPALRDDTPSEVADAQSDGTKKVAAVTKDATDKMADDQRKLSKAQNREARDSADAAYKVSITNSKAAHKIAIEHCKDLAGDARKDCAKNADAELEVEKAQAEVERSS